MKKFSIVAYLEGKSKDRVRTLQEELFKLTGSRACIDAWEPHVTVGDGIWVTEEELQEVESTLQKMVESQNEFNVKIKDIGGIIKSRGGEGEVSTPYVIWINVEVNSDLKDWVEKVKDNITSKYKLWYEMPKHIMAGACVFARGA